MRFFPAEIFLSKIILGLGALDVVVLLYKQIGVDIAAYLGSFAIGFAAIAFGQIYRKLGRDEGISLASTSAGLFILFTLVGSIFNYCLLPIQFPRIDVHLAQFDALLGFSWVDFTTWASKYPLVGPVLTAVYFSSMPQLVLVIVILGFTKRMETLHTALITGVFAGLLTFATWYLFPAFGATSVYGLPDDVLQRMPIAVGPAYGQELVRLSVEAVHFISPKDMLGIIGFPSFHTVMAAISVVFMRQFKSVWIIFVVLNALMVPAIIIQGGHHLSDLLGGLAVFTLSFVLAKFTLGRLNQRNNDTKS